MAAACDAAWTSAEPRSAPRRPKQARRVAFPYQNHAGGTAGSLGGFWPALVAQPARGPGRHRLCHWQGVVVGSGPLRDSHRVAAARAVRLAYRGHSPTPRPPPRLRPDIRPNQGWQCRHAARNHELLGASRSFVRHHG